MSQSVTIHCDRRQLDHGVVVGTCAARVGGRAADEARAAAVARGWVLGSGAGDLCPSHSGRRP